jgi:hypothetical protein
LDGHYSEVPFSDLGPSSFVGNREVGDCRLSNSGFSGGSVKLHPGDMACRSKKSTILMSFEGINGKALNEAGRCNTVANCMSDGYVANGSNASAWEITKAIEHIL